MTGSTTVSRTGDFKIVIIPVFDWFELTASAGCYDENTNSDLIELDIGVTLGDKDNSETFSVTVKVPSLYNLSQGRSISDGLFLLNEIDISTTLTIILPDNNTFAPFTVQVTAEVTDVVKPGISLAQSVDTSVELCRGRYSLFFSSAEKMILKATMIYIHFAKVMQIHHLLKHTQMICHKE